MADDRLDAVERLAMAQNDALRVLIEHVRALTIVNGALVAQLGTDADRNAIREAALGALGPGELVAGGLAARLVEELTRDPAERQGPAGTVLADSFARLQ